MFGRNPFVRSGTPSPPKERPKEKFVAVIPREPSPEPPPRRAPSPEPVAVPIPSFLVSSSVEMDPFRPKDSTVAAKPVLEPEDSKSPGLIPRHNEKRGNDMLKLRAKLFKLLDMLNNGETPPKGFCIECGVLPNITVDGVHRAIKGAQTLIDMLGAEPPVPTAPTAEQVAEQTKITALLKTNEQPPAKKPKVAQYDWS